MTESYFIRPSVSELSPSSSGMLSDEEAAAELAVLSDIGDDEAGKLGAPSDSFASVGRVGA